MGKTAIEWTDYSWNPIRARNAETGQRGWFCVHASDGCKLCYAERMNLRLGNGVEFKAQNEAQVEIYLDEKALLEPMRWKKPRVIFVCSMTDIGAAFVTNHMLHRIFAVMALCPQHTFIVLTKRPARLNVWLSQWRGRRFVAAIVDDETNRVVDFPLPNVWLGVSIEDRKNGLVRGPELAMTPAAVRVWSIEPLLSDLGDMTQLGLFDTLDGQRKAVDWVIVGGESGKGARPMHPDWVRSIRDQCAKAGVAFFFKQWGERAPITIPKSAWSGELPIAWPKGRLGAHPWPDHDQNCVVMRRVGKGAAGRLLDGREHNDRPPTQAERSAA
jgi:protein gp37